MQGFWGVVLFCGQVHAAAMAAAAKRKAIAKAVVQAAGNPKLKGADEDSKRLRSPNMLSTPSTSTPQPKHLRDCTVSATPKKILFAGEGSTPASTWVATVLHLHTFSNLKTSDNCDI